MIYEKIREREKLYEACDKNNRPICLLPLDEIQRQKLYYRSIAILLTDRRKKTILEIKADETFDFSHFEALPAGYNPYEYAEKISLELWKSNNLVLIREIKPCSESENSFVKIFSVNISNAMAQMIAKDAQKYLLADDTEILSLMKFGCGFNPLFKLIYKNQHV